MSDAYDAATAYDEVAYPNWPVFLSHPDRLAAIASLLGLTAPALETARVLEIGCSCGNNLIPMAEASPTARFLGIDLSEHQIAEGKKTVAAIGLTNIEFRRADLRDFRDEGKFDFIIAHGVFSWISPEAQAKLLQLVKDCLSPQGIAYLSYNTLPGWHMRGMVREMMIRHAGKFATTAEKIRQARALLEFLADAVPAETGPYAQFLRSEVGRLSQHSDGYLFHEYLALDNNPVYFQDFMERASAAGLAYLADSDLSQAVLSDLHSRAQRLFSGLASVVETEQYIDFLRNRMFRMSLLVHDHQRPERRPTIRPIRGFHLMSTLRAEGPTSDPLSSDPVKFQSAAGYVKTGNPLVKAALQTLAEASPGAIGFGHLLSQALARVGRSAPTEPAAIDQVAQEIGETLLLGYTSLPPGCIEFFVRPIPVAAEAGEMPRASRIARHLAATGTVINLRHQTVRLQSDFERHLLPMLTGERDRQALIDLLQELVHRQVLELRDHGVSVVDPDHVRRLLPSQLDSALKALAERAILTSSLTGPLA